ncbi:YeaH/YhbH family protein [Rhizosaccharibacter radicis]|uniref:UPF0229 protein NFI88_11490 n=1 Tax=Rhizosaccharibacter radicis TaxID=2782605 RepID=A0ABT1VYP3_9PROT|nr:YeaH/YhbH family protein [Acetobacteraceae bacterium KSS12]
MDIIDRRQNPHGKSLENRQRVLVRARGAVQKAARDAVAAGRLREVGQGGAVSIPSDVLHEPSLHVVFTGGERHLILSGNKSFSRGDRLQRPPGRGGSGGQGAEAGQGGGGQDEFRFVLSREEFLDLFFDDLELPDLVKRDISTTEQDVPSRAGLSSDGAPSQLDMSRTMRLSMARRIGLRRPKASEIEENQRRLDGLLARLESLPEGSPAWEMATAEVASLRELLQQQQRRLGRIAWIDPVDLRYRRFNAVRRPSTRAVMFCLMDVSGSMTERMKDLAKQFFLLLHVFLERRYKHVELVFIRHADAAEVVDEQAFFHDPRSGGTIVSSALLELLRVQNERFPADGWNIYVAQASDGDNAASDTPVSRALLQDRILPLVQHFAYIEIASSGAVIRGETDLWRGYRQVAEADPRLAMRQVSDKRDIFPVFRELFGRRPEAVAT